MAARLLLICHGATAATRQANFPADEPLEEPALRAAARIKQTLGDCDRAWTSPALRATQTAAALSLTPEIDPALRDCDYGSWNRRSLAELQAEEPERFGAWLSNPDAAPHGGEPLSAVYARMSVWMQERLSSHGRFIAVTHASVMRAAILYVLDAPLHAFWRLDIDPLGIIDLRSDGRRWKLRTGQVYKAGRK